MALNIGNYQAEGPYPNVDALQHSSGVYVIVGRHLPSSNWNVVDVGESGNVRERVANHDRQDQWKRTGFRELGVAPIYCPSHQRMQVEQELRRQFNPPCGDR